MGKCEQSNILSISRAAHLPSQKALIGPENIWRLSNKSPHPVVSVDKGTPVNAVIQPTVTGAG